MSERAGTLPQQAADTRASDEVLLDFDEIKAELLTLLDDVDTHSLGSFATSGVLPHAVNPGLSINGLGGIGLPLSTRDASELSKIAHQAPFGKGSETIVDTKIRNTWELDPSHFTLRNSEWQQCVDRLTSQVTSELGVLHGDKNVPAELYKLLLYDKSVFLSAIKTRRRLMACLEPWSLQYPPVTEEGVYADVEHAVQPITTGYRLVLTYNLISHGEYHSAATLGDDYAKLCKLLTSWHHSDEATDYAIDTPGKLAYLLDHEYTEAGLRLDRLKGKDRRKAEYLQRACDEHNFCVFLAQLEFSKEGGCDEPEDGYGYGIGSSYYGNFHGHFDVYETELHLLKVFDLNGEEIATDVDSDENDLVQEDAFDDQDPDDEEFGGYTGNEGVNSTHFFRRTCIVVVPRSRRVDFLFESQIERNSDVVPWANSMLQKLSETPEDANTRIDLESLCELIITHRSDEKAKTLADNKYYTWNPPRPVLDTGMSTGASIALRLRRPHLLERLVQTTDEKLSSEIYESLGRATAQDGWTEWRTSLEKAFAPITKVRSHHDALYHVRRGFGSVGDPKEGVDMDSLTIKMWEALLSRLESMTEIHAADAEPLSEMTSSLGEKALTGSIVPFVEKHKLQVDFVVSFLYCLKENSAIDQSIRLQVHNDVHGKLAALFNTRSAFSPDKSTSPNMSDRNWRYSYPHQARSEKSEDTRNIEESIARFTVFLAQSLSWGLSDNVFEILDRIAAEIPHIDDFAAFLVPFLRSCGKTTLKDDKTGHYRSLVLATVQAYVERYVGMEPARPQDWSRPHAGCGCKDCIYLSNWLVDPQQRQIRDDGIAQPPKRHLEGQLHRDHDCTYEHDRKVSPHGLVITKTQNRWQQEHRDWTRRSKQAIDNIKSIAPEAVLMDLLGDKHHQYLDLTEQKLPADLNNSRKMPPSVGITQVTPKSPAPRSLYSANIKNEITAGRTNTPSLARPPLKATNAANRPPPPSAAGVKRPHTATDIIDLTEP